MTGIKKAGLGLAAIFVLLALAAAWKLGPALAPPTHVEVGIAVGEMAPVEIGLLDSAEHDTDLGELLGEQGTVLILTRSVDWCPFCKAQLMETNMISGEIADRGYTLVGLSYDPPSSLNQFITDENISYSLVSDRDSEFIDAVGLRDPQYSDDPEVDGVPYATVMLIAADGTVQSKLVSSDYRQRPSNDYVLEMIDAALDGI